MQEQDSSPTPLSRSKKPKKPLDMVVKLALGVLVMSFTLIWGGMYLSRPDRTIPPYSVGSQVGHIVAMHVPRDTTDQGVETLLKRFRKVGRKTHHFAAMKIQPTTPGDVETDSSEPVSNEPEAERFQPQWDGHGSGFSET